MDTVSTQPLLEHVAEARRRREDRRPRPPGITEWTLSNGVRVVLEPTTFKQDEILFRAFSPGGTSLAQRSGLRRRRNGRPDRVRGRARHAQSAIDVEQEARRQDRRRASRHRRDVRRAERPHAAPRSRNDVSVDLPDVHAAARRCRGVSRGDRSAERRAWPTVRRCPTPRSKTR